jgi:hypothetical protein
MPELPVYYPDAMIAKRKAENDAKPKPPVTADKPVHFQVNMKPGTKSKHYPRKARKAKLTRDPRDVQYY